MNYCSDSIAKDSNGRPYCTLCGSGVMPWANVQSHLDGQRHQGSLHNSSANQQQNDSESETSNDDLPEHIERDNEGRPYCALCGTGPMSLAVMDAHLNGQRHQNNLLPDHIQRDTDGNLYCTLCNTGRMTMGNLHSHINGACHQENLPSRHADRSVNTALEIANLELYQLYRAVFNLTWLYDPTALQSPTMQALTARFAPHLPRPHNVNYLDEFERRGAAMAKDPDAVECSICLIHLTGHNEEITLPCEHTFHKPS